MKRSLDSATASGMKDQNIPGYCDGTKQGISEMLASYAELAEWHVEKLYVPTFTLQYEELLEDPQGVISLLANFMGIESSSKVRKASKLVGKYAALWRYYLHRLLFRAPRKLIRIITRQENI